MNKRVNKLSKTPQPESRVYMRRSDFMIEGTIAEGFRGRQRLNDWVASMLAAE